MRSITRKGKTITNRDLLETDTIMRAYLETKDDVLDRLDDLRDDSHNLVIERITEKRKLTLFSGIATATVLVAEVTFIFVNVNPAVMTLTTIAGPIVGYIIKNGVSYLLRCKEKHKLKLQSVIERVEQAVNDFTDAKEKVERSLSEYHAENQDFATDMAALRQVLQEKENEEKDPNFCMNLTKVLAQMKYITGKIEETKKECKLILGPEKYAFLSEKIESFTNRTFAEFFGISAGGIGAIAKVAARVKAGTGAGAGTNAAVGAGNAVGAGVGVGAEATLGAGAEAVVGAEAAVGVGGEVGAGVGARSLTLIGNVMHFMSIITTSYVLYKDIMDYNDFDNLVEHGTPEALKNHPGIRKESGGEINIRNSIIELRKKIEKLEY